MKPLHPFSLLRMSLLLLLLSLAVTAQTSQFTYQGQLTDGNNPANSDYDFQFKLFDALTEGTQTGTTVTRDNITVSNGIFSVTLDFGAAAFPGANRFLEIAVRPGTSTGSYTLLTPRQPVLSTPYAVRSLSAATADAATNAINFSGSLTGDVTGTQGATTVVKLRGQTIASTVPVAGQVMKFNGTTNQWEPATDDSSGGTLTGITAGTGLNGGGVTGNVSLNIANSGVGTAQLADNSVTDAKLVSVSGGKVTGAVANATSATNAANAANATTAVNFSGTLGGDVTGNQTATIIEKLRNVALPAPVAADNGKVLKYKNNGVDPVTYEWTTDNISAGGGVTSVTASGPLASSGGATPNISLTGVVPLAQGGTGANLSATGGAGHYLKQASVGGAVTVGGIPATDIPDLGGSYIKNGTATQSGSNFNISGNGTASGTLSGHIVNTTTQYNLGGVRILTSISNNLIGGASAGIANMTGDSNTFFGTSAGAGNTHGGANVFVGINSGNVNTIGTYNTVLGANANLNFNNLTNATAIGAGARVGCSNCMVLGDSTNVGIGTVTPQAKLHVVGQTRTSAIQITGGSDFSENFDVNLPNVLSKQTALTRIEAGMLVSIDPRNPGKLVISNQVYDRRVAGIISGAGDVKPGMIMGQAGSLADGAHPVALSGRVYCWVDAANAAIAPGDLLTTSNTPGHAMKVTDVAKAQGAIIGKAMTELREGKGLVLVLVTLQ